MRIDLTTDAARFLTEAEPLLRRDPLRHTVIASTVVNLAAGRSGAMTTRFLSVRAASGAVVGLAMSTRGAVYLGELPPDSVPAVADAFAEVGALRSVEGVVADAEAFTAHWATRTGGTHRVRYTTRLFQLDDLRVPSAPGSPRLATVDDVAVCLELVRAFAAESDAPLRLDEAAVRSRVEAGWWWLWEHDGVATTLVARHPAVFGWARIGPVYTPPPLRGNGFASALTAHVAATIRTESANACLFTDLANPTSNKIYRSIGFTPVRDFAHHILDN